MPYVLRKFAGLLPAATATTLLSLAGELFLLSERHWQELTEQAVAAVGYTMNFWLQRNAVDYLAQARSTASVFQHFWSLSIQGLAYFDTWGRLWEFAAARSSR